MAEWYLTSLSHRVVGNGRTLSLRTCAVQSLGRSVGRHRLGPIDVRGTRNGSIPAPCCRGSLQLQRGTYRHSFGNRILSPLVEVGVMGTIRHCGNGLCAGGDERMGTPLLDSHADSPLLHHDMALPAAIA